MSGIREGRGDAKEAGGSTATGSLPTRGSLAP